MGGQFDDLDTLRTQAQRSKIYLQDQLESYRKRIQTTKEQVKSVSFAYEQVKKELEGNETAEKLKGLEVKLSNYGQQTFTLQEFVATRGRATDYETLKNNCMSIMSQLNQLAIEAQQRSNFQCNPILSIQLAQLGVRGRVTACVKNQTLVGSCCLWVWDRDWGPLPPHAGCRSLLVPRTPRSSVRPPLGLAGLLSRAPFC